MTTHAAIGSDKSVAFNPPVAQDGGVAVHVTEVANSALRNVDASQPNQARGLCSRIMSYLSFKRNAQASESAAIDSGEPSTSSTRKKPAILQNAIKAYSAQKQRNESLRNARSDSDPLDIKRAYTSTNNPLLAAATTLLVKEPTRIFQETILEKNLFSGTKFSNLSWGLKGAIPSLFKATMKFVSSPLESCGVKLVSNWEKDLNDNVQAGNTGLVKRVASVVAHGILSGLKIARVALAVFAAIGVTAAAIVGATGLALGLLGALVVTCPFWIPAAAVAYKLNKEIADLKNDVRNLKTSHEAEVLSHDAEVSEHAVAQLDVPVLHPHVDNSDANGS